MIELLAGAGGVHAALPAALDRRVTVHVTQMTWDPALVAVLDTAGLGYRYEPTGKQLRIAPLAELDAERVGSPHGFLEVSHRADSRVVIDGAETVRCGGRALPSKPRSGRRSRSSKRSERGSPGSRSG